MPSYRYAGYAEGGRRVSGSIDAEGRGDAIRRLRARGVRPSTIDEHKGTGGRAGGAVLDSASLPVLTRQMAVLLGAGVPMIEALGALSRECAGQWRPVISGVREAVMGGASLDRAMRGYPGAFPEFYLSMVEAGQQSGTLDRVLVNLADYLEGRQRVREQVRSAMLYPLIVMGVGVLVLVLLFTYVVPKIVTIFENTQAVLPVSTRLLIWMSGVVKGYWWLLPVGVALGVPLWRRVRGRFGLAMDAIGMRVFGELYLSRFAMSLSFLLGGGLPMLRALELAGRTSGNSHLGAVVNAAALRVSEGASLAVALGDGMPPVLRELIATGERSGELAELLGRAARSYEEDFERRVTKALTLLGPAMIMVMGVMVGFIVYSVLIPLFELNQLVK